MEPMEPATGNVYGKVFNHCSRNMSFTTGFTELMHTCETCINHPKKTFEHYFSIIAKCKLHSLDRTAFAHWAYAASSGEHN